MYVCIYPSINVSAYLPFFLAIYISIYISGYNASAPLFTLWRARRQMAILITVIYITNLSIYRCICTHVYLVNWLQRGCPSIHFVTLATHVDESGVGIIHHPIAQYVCVYISRFDPSWSRMRLIAGDQATRKPARVHSHTLGSAPSACVLFVC